jgi:3'-phosphoadenosine 5'-phosphosulfate sulfotransferase
MPLNISKLGKILKNVNRLEGIKEFNATLPVKIEVKKEINPIRYLIKLGNKEVETKSSVPLEIGKKYFAEIKEIKSRLQISNLKEIPEILDVLEKINLKTPKNESKLNIFTKEEILHHLANAQNKSEFIFFSNMLTAYTQKIHHLIINDKKKALIQYKYEKNRVKFYAVFNHLGELEGEISTETLTIYSPYTATLQLIGLYKDELNLKLFLYKKETKPIYVFSENLLNLKV